MHPTAGRYLCTNSRTAACPRPPAPASGRPQPRPPPPNRQPVLTGLLAAAGSRAARQNPPGGTFGAVLRGPRPVWAGPVGPERLRGPQYTHQAQPRPSWALAGPLGQARAPPPNRPRTAVLTSSRPGGQNSSIALDQTGYGAIRRAHWGGLNRTFPGPYSPASALSMETPCFGPWTRVPRSEQKKSDEMAPNLNWRRGWLGGMPEGPWELRGAWAKLN